MINEFMRFLTDTELDEISERLDEVCDKLINIHDLDGLHDIRQFQVALSRERALR